MCCRVIIMRLTACCFKRGWLAENKVEFQELLPLKLKNSVSGKNKKEESNACVQEIMNLLSCLKKTEYDQGPCSKELNSLSNCFKVHREDYQKELQIIRKGIIIPGSKNLNHRQIGVMLKRFPSN